MAGAGSAYNLHMKTTQNKVKIGNYVEERALIETAPTACVPVRYRPAAVLPRESWVACCRCLPTVLRAPPPVHGCSCRYRSHCPLGQAHHGREPTVARVLGMGPWHDLAALTCVAVQIGVVGCGCQWQISALVHQDAKAGPPRHQAFRCASCSGRRIPVQGWNEQCCTCPVVAPCWEPDAYTTCTRDDFVQVATHKERKIGPPIFIPALHHVKPGIVRVAQSMGARWADQFPFNMCQV